MDYQTVWNAILGGLTGFLGWFAKELYTTMTGLKEDLNQFRVEVARDYIPKSEVKALRDELMSALRRIEDKLEKK